MKNFLLIFILLFVSECWARGGGGCFLPETRILRSDGTSASIRHLQIGDDVMAFDAKDRIVTAKVRQVFSREVDSYLRLQTTGGVLEATREHPFSVGHGSFRTLQELRAGDQIYLLTGKTLGPVKIESIEEIQGRVRVYNLLTTEPHTYFAEGMAVHNKGGDGGGGHGRGHSGGSYHGYHSRSTHRSASGGSATDSGDAVMAFLILILAVGVTIWFAVQQNRKKLDHLYSERQILSKAQKTKKLLDFLSKQDPLFSSTILKEEAQTVFFLLQECWRKRDYLPMQSLVFPDLYQQHTRQLAGMISNHEINVLEKLEVNQIHLVNVRYTNKPELREFTALISATARDTYVDDRNGKFLRGDKLTSPFQEFWTFQLQGGVWKLREIEQTAESDILKDDNFFEAFTDEQMEKIYGASVFEPSAVGPWANKKHLEKATQVERLLNFLYETDKLWNRSQMLMRARTVFSQLYLGLEARAIGPELNGAMFPELRQHLDSVISEWKARDYRIEYRNLCVRKVELILVRNYNDNKKDEFLVRISAHAQRISIRGDRVIQQDSDVMPFAETCVFGRHEKQWKLKELIPETEARKINESDSVDEGSSEQMMKWFYSKKRTV